MGKLNLGPRPDIIDKTKANLDKLRKVERGMVKSWLDRFVKKANTEVLDALAPIKYAEDEAGVTDAADSGYVAARMATGAASTMQATMLYGLPEWKDGVIQRKAGTGEGCAARYLLRSGQGPAQLAGLDGWLPGGTADGTGARKPAQCTRHSCPERTQQGERGQVHGGQSPLEPPGMLPPWI